jgi:hypothetical protein
LLVFDVSVNTVNIESDGKMIISELSESCEIRIIRSSQAKSDFAIIIKNKIWKGADLNEFKL